MFIKFLFHGKIILLQNMFLFVSYTLQEIHITLKAFGFPRFVSGGMYTIIMLMPWKQFIKKFSSFTFFIFIFKNFDNFLEIV